MNFYRQHLILINTLLALLFVAGLTISAIGNSSGKTGSTQNGCSCHGSASSNSSVSLTSGSGSFTVDPNSTTTFTVGIDNSGKVNAGMNAGVKTSESGGSNAGTLTAGTGTKISGGEVTHNGEQALSGGKFDFTFDWKSPAEHGEYWIRGVANAVDNNGNTSGDEWNRFTTQKVIVAGVTVTAPNGGQSWCLGSSQNITWNSDGITNVKIEYSSNGGSDWNNIVASTFASSGSFSWDIPNGLSEGSGYVIRISDADKASRNDVSNNSFSIIGDVEITEQPSADEICSGESFSMSVSVTGSGNQFQWRKNDVNIAGANQSTFTKSNTSTNDAGDYDCVITTSCGNEITSNKATLTVNQSLAFATQPSNQSGCEGSSVTLQASVEGEISTLQWRKDGQDISGANSQSLTINNLSSSDEGDYTLFVTSDKCNSQLESSVATVSLTQSPIIVGQPESEVGCEGGEVRFVVQAGGEIEGYQWYKDDAVINGETEKTLTISNLNTDDVGAYKVEIEGKCNELITSNEVNLTLNSAPTITTQPVGKSIFEEEAFTLSVVADNPGDDNSNLTYQWLKDDQEIDDANQSDYSVPSANLSDAGMYKVTVSNSCDLEITSDEIEVKVLENNGGPAITVNVNVIDLGEVEIGQSNTVSSGTVLTNSGDEALTITAFEVIGSGSDDYEILNPSLPITLNPSETIDVQVEFTPSSVGEITAILGFESNSVNDATIELKGIGVDNRTIVSSVNSIDFGSVVQDDMVTQPLKLTNTSSKDITIVKTVSTTNEITTDVNDNTTLGSSDELDVNVSFKPTEVKNYDETLTIELSDGNVIDISVVANAVMTSVSYGIPTLNNAISYPNPSQNNIVIKLDFEKVENFSINIVDVNGNPIRAFEGVSNIGTNEIDWDIRDSFGIRISSGSYYALVKVGDRIQTIPIVIN
ncbi:MAG: immunoglobulin domain-containing protein [Chlorobiota bacterium]